MTDRLALLRGINVGGKNLVKMEELRAAFEAMDFEDVATYINSGNVLFAGPRERREDLEKRVERELKRDFGIELKVVTLTRQRLQSVVDGAPKGFGDDEHRCDVIFLRGKVSVPRLFAKVDTRDGIDKKWKGSDVLYFSRLTERASGSRLSKIAALPEYQEMTIRNWKTTSKLLALMDDRASTAN